MGSRGGDRSDEQMACPNLRRFLPQRCELAAEDSLRKSGHTAAQTARVWLAQVPSARITCDLDTMAACPPPGACASPLATVAVIVADRMLGAEITDALTDVTPRTSPRHCVPPPQ
jgi:hypothetical protein